MPEIQHPTGETVHLETLEILNKEVASFQEIYYQKNTNKLHKKIWRPLIREVIKIATPMEVPDTILAISNWISFFVYHDYVFVIHEWKNKLIDIATPHDISDEKRLRLLWPRIVPRIVTATQPPLEMEKVRFTTHALERFEQRYYKQIPRDDHEKVVRKLLSQSTEHVMNPSEKVLRIINNGFCEARYFITETRRYRFVVKEHEDLFFVVTFEPFEQFW